MHALCYWWPTIILALATLPGSLSAQPYDALPSRDDAWIAARDAMRSALGRLENFTCIQNIRREAVNSGAATRSEPEREDFVRLQVTSIGGKEFYSFPGDTNAVTEPHLLVKTGLSGTGAFFGYARTVFVKHPFTSLHLVGREIWQGRPALRFRFEFDQIRERLDVSRGGGIASMGAAGEFLVDEGDSLVRWMRIIGNQPAPELGIRSVAYEIRWSLLRDASGDGNSEPLLIPEWAEMRMDLYTGEVQRNEIHLTQCREFQVETALRFDVDESSEQTDSVETAAARVKAERHLAGPAVLPAGLELQLALEEPCVLPTAAVGEPLRARLTRSVVGTDGVLLAAGSLAELRIRRYDRVSHPEQHTVIWIELSGIRTDTRIYLGLAELDRKDRVHGMVDRIEKRVVGRAMVRGDFGSSREDTVEEVIYPSIPGVGAFLFRGEASTLPKGYKMTWTTISARSGNP